MRNRDAWFVLLICAFLVGLTATRCWMTHQTTAPTSVDQALKTAKVIGDAGSGSCAPVFCHGGVVGWLTCAHVVDLEPDVVELPNGDRMPILSLARHPDVDVGIVWTRANPALPIEEIPLGPMPKPGTRILLAGYPAELTSVWLAEGLQGVRSGGEGWVWCSVPIWYGCSGGPVLVDGKLVGVAEGIYRNYKKDGASIPTISAIAPIESFRDWLQEQTACAANVK
jgi:hypothetical protein